MMSIHPLDPRIGQLNGPRYYAYAQGYGAPPVVGSLAEVHQALGLTWAEQKPAQVDNPSPKPKPVLSHWRVTMRFQWPAWDEKDGIVYEHIPAESKSAAIRSARRLAACDGHAVGGRGRYWFSAAKIE